MLVKKTTIIFVTAQKVSLSVFMVVVNALVLVTVIQIGKNVSVVN